MKDALKIGNNSLTVSYLLALHEKYYQKLTIKELEDLKMRAQEIDRQLSL